MEREIHEDRYLNAFMSTWAIHKTNEPSDLSIETYWRSLEKYDIKQVEQAFGYAINELQWFPKPVELRHFIESGPGDIEDIALVEADKVINAIRKHGYKSITFDNPVTMAVIVQGWGGWIKICDLKQDDNKWFRKDFVLIYKAYSAQGIKSYDHLVGFHEDNNAFRWPERIPAPMLIGNNIKAQKVLDFNKPKLIEGRKNNDSKG